MICGLWSPNKYQEISPTKIVFSVQVRNYLSGIDLICLNKKHNLEALYIGGILSLSSDILQLVAEPVKSLVEPVSIGSTGGLGYNEVVIIIIRLYYN